MGIITKEKLEEKLKEDTNLCNIIETPKVNHLKLRDSGRREGDKNIPKEVRELAGVLAHVDKQSNVAKELNISDSQVSHYKRGQVGPGRPDEELKDSIDRRLGVVKDVALDRLLDSLDGITPEKLKSEKVGSLSRIAQSLSAVVERVSDKKPDNSLVNINLYMPRLQSESDMEVIDIERVS